MKRLYKDSLDVLEECRVNLESTPQGKKTLLLATAQLTKLDRMADTFQSLMDKVTKRAHFVCRARKHD